MPVRELAPARAGLIRVAPGGRNTYTHVEYFRVKGALQGSAVAVERVLETKKVTMKLHLCPSLLSKQYVAQGSVVDKTCWQVLCPCVCEVFRCAEAMGVLPNPLWMWLRVPGSGATKLKGARSVEKRRMEIPLAAFGKGLALGAMDRCLDSGDSAAVVQRSIRRRQGRASLKHPTDVVTAAQLLGLRIHAGDSGGTRLRGGLLQPMKKATTLCWVAKAEGLSEDRKDLGVGPHPAGILPGA